MAKKPTYEELQEEMERLKRENQMLMKSKKRFSTLIENVVDWVWEVDVNGIYTYVSTQVENILGYRKAEVLGKTPFHFMTQREAKRITPIFLKAVASKNRIIGLKDSMLTKDGRDVTFETNATPILDNSGELKGFMGTCRDITERMNMEKTIHEKEKATRALLNASTESEFIIELDGTIVILNEMTAKRLGKRSEDIIGSNIYDFLPPDVAESRKRYVKEVVSKRKPIRFEDERSGIIFDQTIYPLTNDRGEVIQVAVFGRDITDSRKSEQILRESEEKYRSLFENAQDAIFVAEPESGNLVDINRLAEQLTGYSKKELIGKHQTFIHPPKLSDFYRDEFRKATEREGLKFTEMLIQRKDGSQVPVEISSGGVFEVGSKKLHIGIFRDITERKKAEEELKKSSLIISSTTDAVITTDIKGNITFWNKGAEALYGYSKNEILGKSISIFYKDEDRHILDSMIAELLQGKDIPSTEVTCVDRNQKDVHILLSLTTEKDENGNVVELIGITKDITDRKKVEEALREKEEVMRYIIKYDPNAIAVYDQDLRYIAVSDRYLEDYNIQDKDIVGKHHYEVFPEIPQRWKDVHQRVLQGATERNDDDYFERPDGSITYNRWECRPWFTANGSIGGMITYTEVTTERKLAEQDLRRQRDRFQEYLNVVDAIIVALDREGRVTLINPKGCKVLGRSRESIVGENWFTTCLPQPEGMKDVYPFFLKLIAGELEAAEYFENQIITLGSELRDIAWHNALLKDDDGHIIGTLSFGEDITIRKQAERKLQEFTKLQETLLESLPQPVFYKNTKGEYIGCNKAFEEFIGMSKEEVIGKTVFDLGRKEIADTYYEKDQELFQNPGKQSYEWKVNTGKEEVREVIFDKATFTGADGKIAGLIGVVTDITERKKIEAHLRQAQKMEAMGTLAGGIAHDFNNILTPVIIQTELALLNVTDDSPMKNSLQEVLEASHRAKDLVKQILTFSRKSESKPVPMTLTPVVKEALKLLRSTLPTTIELKERLQMETRPVLSDPTQVHQVLMNLCTNAAHAMRKEGGVLTVSLSETRIEKDHDQPTSLAPGEYLKLSVSDTGHGMDNSIKDRIFEPFFTTKERGEGTGMGLSVVHGIMESFGGSIEVETELGRGTTFHVFFPKSPSNIPTESESSFELPTGDEHVLLVDDEKIMVDSVGAMLKHLGYKVTVRTSSIEALEAFRNQPDRFDLVITDQTMPNMRGDELAQKLIGLRPNIPIILCTGFSEMVNEEKAKAMGVKEYVMKPIVMKDMAIAIRKVLDPEGQEK